MVRSLRWTYLRPVVDAPFPRLYAQRVRFLLVNNHCISDPTAGVTHSLRTIMEWLAYAGHACHILSTARFESAVTFTIEDHLRQQRVALSHLATRGGRSKRISKTQRAAAPPL